MNLNRRNFLGGACAAAPFFLAPARALFAAGATPAPSGKINLAIIGCGTQGTTNIRFFLMDARVRVTMVCDPVFSAPGYSYDSKAVCGRDEFRKMADAHYKQTGCRMTHDWREVVDDPTIDAVCIATPDHWHALIAAAAMRKGKHVYCQKPMTNGISEGIAMTRIAKESGVTFQVGSQHRSSSPFRVLGEWYRNGYLGECKYAEIGLSCYNKGCWGHGTDVTPRVHPAYFDDPKGGWDMWQGPAEHFADNAFIPGIHEPMVWRWNKRYGGGNITDWGSHWFDAFQWVTDRQRTGPVRIENMQSNVNVDDPHFSWANKYSFDLIYADGFHVHVFDTPDYTRKGVRLVGAKGSAYADHQKLVRPDYLAKWNEKRDLGPNEVHLYRPAAGHSHESDFIDGILERRPIATDCEIGHRSVTVAHIANICLRLRLSSLAWDPRSEKFTGPHADEANRLAVVEHHNGWKL